MIALIVILSVVAYLGIGTIVGAKRAVQLKLRRKYDPEFSAALTGLFWPIGVCFLFGVPLMERGLRKAEQKAADLRKREQAVSERERLLEITCRELEAL